MRRVILIGQAVIDLHVYLKEIETANALIASTITNITEHAYFEDQIKPVYGEKILTAGPSNGKRCRSVALACRGPPLGIKNRKIAEWEIPKMFPFCFGYVSKTLLYLS